jgi:hypothetical protein
MGDYELTSVLPADDDTFMVMRECLGSEHGYCYRIARVFAFGLMTSDEKRMSNFIAPIDGQGMPWCEDTIGQEAFAVRGCDLSPCGRVWGEIYKEIVPTGYDVREIPQGVFDDQYDPVEWKKQTA